MFMYMCLYITTVNMPGLEKRNLTTFQSLGTTCSHIDCYHDDAFIVYIVRFHTHSRVSH